jgi:mRNA interferase RelE/StbE
MKTEFRESFHKDIRKLKSIRLADIAEEVIKEVEAAKTLTEISGLEKMTGYSEYFKIKKGDYRFGLKIKGSVITFVRYLHRKDIYRFFP